jgi:hypothetical protein
MQTDYAGFWRRSLAALLDNLVWIFSYVWIYIWIVGGSFLASVRNLTAVVRRAPRVAKERTA